MTIWVVRLLLSACALLGAQAATDDSPFPNDDRADQVRADDAVIGGDADDPVVVLEMPGIAVAGTDPSTYSAQRPEASYAHPHLTPPVRAPPVSRLL